MVYNPHVIPHAFTQRMLSPNEHTPQPLWDGPDRADYVLGLLRFVSAR